MKDEGYGSGAVLLSFLLGGVVGAGLALLLAPQSGIETRRKIKELADDIKEKTNEYISETKEKVSSAVDEGKGYYEEKKSLIKSAIDAGKDAYEKEKEKHAKGEHA
jgi:gas vesicle protein